MADLRSPIELRCEHLRDPLGVDSAAPWLSWRLPATDRAVEPVACQVRVAGSVAALQQGHADVWDSGWCTAEAVGAVSYGGPPLVSRQRCWWQVRVRVAEGDESAWSVPAWWEMGLLDADDWHAAWVGLPTEPEGPCPLLRRTFSLAEAPRQARVYVTALGVYELRINGEVVGNRRLAPEWTDYRRRIQYQVHDVTELLQRGENAVGLVLAEGWYLGLLGWAQHGRRENYGPPPPRALAQLEVIDAAGQTHRVVTDRDWRGDEGPIRASSLYRGEHHDARLDPLGWDTAGFADDTWQAVEVHPAPPGRLVAQPCPPIRATKTLAPRRRHTVGADVVRFDFGQNLSGVCQIEVTGPAGAELTLRHGEVLEPDGTLHTANLRKAVSIDRFVLRGAADGTAETWSPRFTCHGFRHVELSGPPAALTEARVSALAVHSDLEPTARFRCSHEMLNRLHEAIHWTIRSNLHAMITDCPQRDERFGWLGDGQAVLPTACYHFDMVALLRKFGADLLDAQHSDGAMPDYCPWVELGPDVVPDHGSPGYMDACVVFPWLAHWFYGDRTMLSRHLDAMLAYLRYIERRNPDHLWRNARGNNYGDWVNAGGKSDKTVIATLHWYRSADLTARAAAAAGRPDVERIARPMADAVAAALRQSCFDGQRFRDGTQANHAMAL
ncbi:MAG: family 78 glycoside hydrolase catalytic domain, partial [Dehalococcoidia bacterium]